MHFTDQQIEDIKAIFNRLDTSTINSLQYNNKANEFRTGCTIAIYNKWNKPICIFQKSPWRMKLLKRLAVKIPFTLYITHPREDIDRVGWKCE